MIIWLTGNTGAGKSTLAKKMAGPGRIILDGDDIRAVNGDSDLSLKGRRANNIRIAKLAKLLEVQGFDVIVSVICPYNKLRDEVKLITGCIFVYLPYKGDDSIKSSPFERPNNADIVLTERMIDVNQSKTILYRSVLGGDHG